MAQSARRPMAVLLILTLRKLGDFILKAKYIVAQMGTNTTLYPSPKPPLADVTLSIAALEAAQLEVDKRVVGAVAVRNQKYTGLLADIRGLQGYVQERADSETDEQAAITMITSSGFSLRRTAVRVKPELSVVNSKISGKVLLTAKAAGSRVSYNWQQSENNGTLWTDLPPTMQAKTSVSSLTPGTKYWFRFRAVSKTGPENWSQAVWVIVT